MIIAASLACGPWAVGGTGRRRSARDTALCPPGTAAHPRTTDHCTPRTVGGRSRPRQAQAGPSQTTASRSGAQQVAATSAMRSGVMASISASTASMVRYGSS